MWMKVEKMDRTNQVGLPSNRLKFIGLIATISSACCTFSIQVYKFLEQRVFLSWIKSSPTFAPIAIMVLLFFLLLLVFTVIGLLLDRRARSAIQRFSERRNAEREKKLAENQRRNKAAIGRWFEQQCEVLVRLYVRTLIGELNIEIKYIRQCYDGKREYSADHLDHLAYLCRLAMESSPICNLQGHPRVVAALQGTSEAQVIRELIANITQAFDKTYQLLVEVGDQKEACLHKVSALIEDVIGHIGQLKRFATDLQKV
jgi:hypothetical protein